MRCPFCNKENPDSARFCGGCGSPLPYYQKAGTWGNGPVYDDTRGNKTPERGSYGGNISAENPGRSLPPGIDPNQNRASKKSPGKKKWIFIGAGAAAAVIVVIVVILIFAGRGTVSEVEETQDEEYLEAAEEYVSVSEEITELTQDDEYINSDTSQKSEVMLELLLQLADAGLLAEDEIYYDEDSQIIWYEYATGGIGAVMLEEHEEDTDGASDGDGYVTEYTDEGLVGSFKYVVEIDTDGCPYEEEDLSALIIYDLGFDKVEEYLNDAATLYWPSEYLSTFMLEGASVETLRTLFSGYDLIMIREHGIINEDGQICIELSQESSFLTRLLYAVEISITESDQTYIDDIQAERICILYTSSGENKFCLMPDFFTYYYGDGGLDDAIVWLGCCNGYMDDSLVGAIAGCGAKAVIGPTESVNTYYGTYMQLAFVYMLMYGNTVEDSLDFAKSVWGENDSVYVSNYYTNSVDDTPAEFRIYNGGDEVFVTLTQEALASLEADGTAVMYQLYYDKLMALQDEYGETVTKESDIYGSWLEGLCFASLIDFDNDNTEELILAYGSSDESEESLDLDYIVEVWEYSDDTISKIFDSTNYETADSWDAIRVSCVDGKYYIFTEIDDVYSAENDAESSQYFYVWGYDENEFTQIEKLEADFYWDSTIYFVNGSEMTEDEYYDEYSGWWEDYVEYRLYMGSLTAEGELENTLSYLMEYLGISAE